MEATLNFELPDMSCGHCVKAITQAVQAADPQARLQVDLPTHHLDVVTAMPRAQLAAALSAAGYPPA